MTLLALGRKESLQKCWFMWSVSQPLHISIFQSEADEGLISFLWVLLLELEWPASLRRCPQRRVQACLLMKNVHKPFGIISWDVCGLIQEVWKACGKVLQLNASFCGFGYLAVAGYSRWLQLWVCLCFSLCLPLAFAGVKWYRNISLQSGGRFGGSVPEGMKRCSSFFVHFKGKCLFSSSVPVSTQLKLGRSAAGLSQQDIFPSSGFVPLPAALIPVPLLVVFCQECKTLGTKTDQRWSPNDECSSHTTSPLSHSLKCVTNNLCWQWGLTHLTLDGSEGIIVMSWVNNCVN